MLQDKFINFIRVHRLADENDSILLGVSGGIDSMVMLHLFQKTGFKFAVAHCNFGLRGEESDGDEEFTRTYCREKGVVFHTTKFSTVQYATDKSVSIQVAARELRYDYFNELCREHGYNKIAIAHNMNDSAETVLLNLIRGAGIRGLTGIRPVHGNIIRPLLFATRPEIENYSKQLGISYREDSSNATLKYKRNFIRHRVIPLLQELNPSAVETIYDSSYHVNEAISLVDRQLDEIRRKVVSFRKDAVLFSVEELKREPAARIFLVEELRHYGFSGNMATQVFDLLESTPGKYVDSPTHTLLRDRKCLILSAKISTSNACIEVGEDCSRIEKPFPMRFERIVEVKIDSSPQVAILNYSKLRFPLTLRCWQPGDRFIPLGMKGYKKVSDYLVDCKVPLNQKNEVYVLLSNNEIAWVVGYRIDDRYKISTETAEALKISVLL